jgi:8-hydroxy-5-deazaflavin:NADPH oxidoreductase
VKEIIVKIGILGTGKMGSRLARHWADAGHDVMFGSRTPDKGDESGLPVGSFADAAGFGDVVAFAVPGTAAMDTAKALGSLSGKTIIDMTNPMGPNMTYPMDHGTSNAEQIAKVAPGAHVVKAFNVAFAAVVENPDFGGQKIDMYYCGDNADAKAAVRQLIEAAGFEPVDLGPLHRAHNLEAMANLIINLAYVEGMGPNIGFKLLRR